MNSSKDPRFGKKNNQTLHGRISMSNSLTDSSNARIIKNKLILKQIALCSIDSNKDVFPRRRRRLGNKLQELNFKGYLTYH